jgi:crotonobetainyl-CoA:carnitine CoA-transferase CaiB-like acyl-CoA transferase
MILIAYMMITLRATSAPVLSGAAGVVIASDAVSACASIQPVYLQRRIAHDLAVLLIGQITETLRHDLLRTREGGCRMRIVGRPHKSQSHCRAGSSISETAAASEAPLQLLLGATPCGLFQTRDGWIVFTVLNHQWERFAKDIGKPELLTDERFTPYSARWDNRHLLEPIIEEWFRSLGSREEVLEFLLDRHYLAAPVLDLRQTVELIKREGRGALSLPRRTATHPHPGRRFRPTSHLLGHGLNPDALYLLRMHHPLYRTPPMVTG